MPINRKWPLEELLEAMRSYPLGNRRKITVEYVMLKDVNDTPDDARRLIRMLSDIPCKINLLPLNAHDRTEFETPPWERVVAFQPPVDGAFDCSDSTSTYANACFL